MNEKSRRVAIVIAFILGTVAVLYAGGLFGQLMTNYQIWMDSGGMWGGAQIASPDWNPLVPSTVTRSTCWKTTAASTLPCP